MVKEETKRNYWFMGLSKWFRNRFIKVKQPVVTAAVKTTKVTSLKRKKPLKRA